MDPIFDPLSPHDSTSTTSSLPSPIYEDDPDEAFTHMLTGVGSSASSRTVLEWDPETEEYRRRVESVETELLPPPPRKQSVSNFDDASFLSSIGVVRKTSDVDGKIEGEMPVHRMNTTLEYDAESEQYRRTIVQSEDDKEGSVHEGAQRTLKRRLTNAMSMSSQDGFMSTSPTAGAMQGGNVPPFFGLEAADARPREDVVGGVRNGKKASTSSQEEDFLHQASRRLFGISNEPTNVERRIQESLTPLQKIIKRFYRDVAFESIWGILLLIGTSMSLLAWCIDELTEVLFSWRDDIAKLPQYHSTARRDGLGKLLYDMDPVLSFFAWWGFALVMGFGSVLIVKYVSPQAAGSGIEQVRSIVTGYSIPGYLDFNTLTSKVIGLVLVQASGLTVGKEGPFVHIACSLANLFLQLGPFKELKKSRALTKQVIGAACSTGISSTFGAPIGGVLFSIEVTSNVFHTADYWKCFFTAITGEVVFRFLSYFGTARPSQVSLFPTDFAKQPYLLSELPGYILLSTICGLYGGLYVKIILGIRAWRIRVLAKAGQWQRDKKARAQVANDDGGADEEDGNQNNSNRLRDVRGRLPAQTILNNSGSFFTEAYYRITVVLLQPMMYAFCVISITAITNWCTGQFMKRTLYSAISDFLVSGEMAQDDLLGVNADEALISRDWGSPSLLFNLIMYFVVKSFLCAIALSLQVPTGTLIPMLAIGLAMGRIWGEIMQMLFGPSFIPGGYALVGASAFIAGATGAVSTAVIVFEITAQLSFMVPILMSVIIGRQAGKLISPDLYEALQIQKNLPNIPPLAHQSSYNTLAVEIMNPINIPMLNRHVTLRDIEGTLDAPSHRHDDAVHDDDLFAIVDSDLHYLASIAHHQLRALLTQGRSTGANPDTQIFDLINSVDTNMIAPSVPITTTANDMLSVFEITLCSALFVTDKCKVVGWVDLQDIRHKCESGEL